MRGKFQAITRKFPTYKLFLNIFFDDVFSSFDYQLIENIKPLMETFLNWNKLDLLSHFSYSRQ